MRRLQQGLQVVVLGLTGLYFAYTIASGNITNYVATRFAWLSGIAAGLLLAMATLKTLAILKPQSTPGPGAHDHGHPHAAGWGAWLGLGIAALPVAFGLLLPSTPLDGRAVEGEISSNLGSIEVIPGEMLGIAPEERNVLEWLRIISVQHDLSVFDGQRADVSGFVYRDGRMDRDTQFMVARFVVSCCVADAQAVGLVVTAPQAADLGEDSWVRVRGTFKRQEFDGQPYAMLIADPGADGVQVIARPRHPYLYP